MLLASDKRYLLADGSVNGDLAIKPGIEIATMKKFALLLCISVVIAMALTWLRNPMSLEERFVRLQAEDRFPAFADWLRDESADVNALLLDYAYPAEGKADTALALKAQAALLQYPDKARRILNLYGNEPTFQDILRRYGDSILPPIEFFFDNDVSTLTAMHSTARVLARTRQAIRGEQAETARVDTPLSAIDRGWYAVNFIDAEGHNFLGQFVTDESGTTQWVQSERVLENLNSFFAGGIRGLETKVLSDQDINAGDLAWAAVDVALIGGAVKLLRAGRAARGVTLTARLSRLGRSGMHAARLAKWPALVATGYVLIKHPSLIGDLFAEVAGAYGVPVWPMQMLGWTLLVLPMLYIASWIFALFVKPFRRGAY